MARGYIIPIGGAENKESDPVILRRFVSLCGGKDARIIIIPTASRLRDTGPFYAKLFEELGCGESQVYHFTNRKCGEDEAWLAYLDKATGVFFTGGNQLRLTTNLGGTTFVRNLRRLNNDGLHIAGTSAGAAYMPAHMIAGGRKGPVPQEGKVNLAPGLGLLNSVLIDQHFRQRDRMGRLLSAMAFNPFAVGLGIDEDTAAFIDSDYNLEVVGSGTITVADPSDLEHSSIHEAGDQHPLCMIGVKVHILTAGATYNLKTRKATPPHRELEPGEHE